MIVKYMAALLICTGGTSDCTWTYGETAHDQEWQCLYDIAKLKPHYTENKRIKFVDCKMVTSYKHE
jgi:hypothetical protein